MGYGKEYRAKEAMRILDPLRRAEEFDGDLEIIDSKSRLWKLAAAGARHYEYDPDQQGEFRRIYRAWDFGKRSAVQFWQKVKMGPTPASYQLRCLGELCTYQQGEGNALLVHEVGEEVHLLMVTWFGKYGTIPCVDYPDVAGRHWVQQTGKTDIKVITEVMRKYEPGFLADAKKVKVREGIDVGSRKMKEILGYEDAEMTKPIAGLVVSPLRAPVTFRALSGALRQNDAGEIDKGKKNKEHEHVGDCARYLFARQVRSIDIVSGPVAAGVQVADAGKLDAQRDRQQLYANMVREFGKAMQEVVVEQPEGRQFEDDWEEEG